MCIINRNNKQPVTICQGKGVAPRAALAKLLSLAVDETGWKRAALASVMGIPESHLSRMLSDEKPISADRFDSFPIEIKRFVISQIAVYFGLHVIADQEFEVAHQQALLALLSVMGKKRQAKAELPEAELKRERA